MEEHNKFIEGVRIYGRNLKKVAKHVGTRDSHHVGSRARYFLKMVEEHPEVEGADIYDVLNQFKRRPWNKLQKNE